MGKRIIVAISMLAVAACSNQADSDQAQQEPVASVSPAINDPVAGTVQAGPVLMRLPDADADDGAALAGTLAANGGCVGIDAADGFIVLAPTNPRITWNGTALTLSDGSVARLGDAVMVGGSQTADGTGLTFISPVPAECAAFPVWIASSITAR